MKTPALESLFNKVIAALEGCNFMKKKLQHRWLPVNIREMFKNTHFEEHVRTAATRWSFFPKIVSGI